MINFTDIGTIVRFFIKQGLRGKRVKSMAAVSLIPAIILIILRVVETFQTDSSVSASYLFPDITVNFMVFLYVPLIALFYGAAVINDEVDDRTLIYLTTSSISRGSIYAGKFLVSLFLCSAIVMFGLTVSFLIANVDVMFSGSYIKDFIHLTCASLLSIGAYLSLFSLFGNMFKRPVLIGLGFVFGWETVMLLIPGNAHMLTISHYIRSILPNMIGDVAMKTEQLAAPSGAITSVITLVMLILGLCALASWVFYSKEYILSDSGS